MDFPKIQNYTRDLAKEVELDVIKKQNERVRKIRKRNGFTKPLMSIPNFFEFGFSPPNSLFPRKTRGLRRGIFTPSKKQRKSVKKESLFGSDPNEMTDKRIAKFIHSVEEYKEATQEKYKDWEKNNLKPYSRLTIKPSDFEHIFTLVNDYPDHLVVISEKGIEVEKDDWETMQDAYTKWGKLNVKCRTSKKTISRYELKNRLNEFVDFSTDPEFNCAICNEKLKDEPSLRSHSLFAHGKYMDCCSTNLMAKTYEQENQARFDYKNFNQKLKMREKYIKKNYKKILDNFDMEVSIDLENFLDSDISYDFDINRKYRESKNHYHSFNMWSYKEGIIKKRDIARLLKHCKNYNDIRDKRNECRKKIEGFVE